MFEPTAPTSDYPGLAYGFGFYLQASPRTWAWHDGVMDGFQTYYGRRPNEGLEVIVLTNREDIGGYDSLDAMIALPAADASDRPGAGRPAGLKLRPRRRAAPTHSLHVPALPTRHEDGTNRCRLRPSLQRDQIGRVLGPRL